MRLTKQIRLNKFLAHYAGISRREADAEIEKGLVLLNGEKPNLGVKIDPEKDQVKYKGELVTEDEQKVYWLVYKPVGFISTSKDTHGRPEVTSMVKTKHRIYPVGRLDAESEGLVLLTNDGDLTYKITHPRFHVPKLYHVRVSPKLMSKDIDKLTEGVMSEGKLLKASSVKVLPSKGDISFISIQLHEGRKRQIRRMLRELGYKVDALKRVAIGSIEIGDMKPGDRRELSEKDISILYKDIHS